MPRPEKTVFISYRRKDISWALAVYHYLTKHAYDVFFDYKSIPSGDFEQIIVGNIKARAHFLVILTPTALDRANEPGDWLRREIENAISERRNIIPLFFDGFNFGAPSVSEKLTGKLGRLKRYNGLEVPSGYFDEAMERLRGRYLDVTLDAVLHPVSEEVQKKVKEHQVAANQAILSKEELEEKARKEKEAQEKKEADAQARIVAELKTKKEREEKERKLAEEKARSEEKRQARRAAFVRIRKRMVETLSGVLATGKGFLQKVNPRQFGIGGFMVLVLLILFYSGNYIAQNLPTSNPPDVTNTPTISPIVSPTVTPTSTATISPTSTVTITPTSTATATLIVTPSPTSAFGVGDTMISEKDDMVMVYVLAGEFEMGSEDGEDNEKPVHTVYLDAFWIDQTEVSNTMFADFLNQQGNQTEGGETWLDASDSHVQIHLDGITWKANNGYVDHPVINVSWYGANAYCSWVSRRLPTEAEWEKAARGTNASVFPWGNDIDCSLANFRYDCIGDTSPVGAYPNGASMYGVLDMAGNVWEWVSDWYASTYYRSSPGSNPQGPSNSNTNTRVRRGGSWNQTGSYTSYVRSSNRAGSSPEYAASNLGFRCAVSATE
jgi:formylglycine-generating enzyme required for sulfatase activity